MPLFPPPCDYMNRRMLQYPLLYPRNATRLFTDQPTAAHHTPTQGQKNCDCSDCAKSCKWCILNTIFCCIPCYASDCNRCWAWCCAPADETREFGMSEYTMAIPLSDVLNVTSHVKVVKVSGEWNGVPSHVAGAPY